MRGWRARLGGPAPRRRPAWRRRPSAGGGTAAGVVVNSVVPQGLNSPVSGDISVPFIVCLSRSPGIDIIALTVSDRTTRSAAAVLGSSASRLDHRCRPGVLAEAPTLVEAGYLAAYTCNIGTVSLALFMLRKSIFLRRGRPCYESIEVYLMLLRKEIECLAGRGSAKRLFSESDEAS